PSGAMLTCAIAGLAKSSSTGMQRSGIVHHVLQIVPTTDGKYRLGCSVQPVRMSLMHLKAPVLMAFRSTHDALLARCRRGGLLLNGIRFSVGNPPCDKCRKHDNEKLGANSTVRG